MVDHLKLYNAPPAEGEEEELGMVENVETSIITLGAYLPGYAAATRYIVTRDT